MAKQEPWTEEEVTEIMFNFENVVVPVMTAEHAKEDGRSGAVLDMRNPFETLIFMRAGTAPEDKFLGYEENARGKNDALDENPKILTSWEVHRGDVSQGPNSRVFSSQVTPNSVARFFQYSSDFGLIV